jgi:hypothetical protein
MIKVKPLTLISYTQQDANIQDKDVLMSRGTLCLYSQGVILNVSNHVLDSIRQHISESERNNPCIISVEVPISSDKRNNKREDQLVTQLPPKVPQCSQRSFRS